MRRMKDSGIEWIGEIPEEWETVPLRHIAFFGKGLDITKADLEKTGIAVISYGQIHSKLNTGYSVSDNLIRYINDSYISSNPSALVKSGDFIFADTSEDIDGIGNCVYIDKDLTLFAGYHTVIARSLNFKHSKYLAFLFMTDAWRCQLRAPASGIKVYSITQKMLKTTSVIVPHPNEQQSIAAYLDEKCSAIDSVTAKLRSSIEKLKEYRLSLITEAVTKGLDPKAPMKDSGVEWIGDVPEHWTLSRLSFLMKSMEGGVSVNAGQEPAKEDELGVLKTSCVSKFVFNAEENKSVNHDEEHRVACPVTANTIIVNRKNTPELVGACGYTDKSYPNIFLSDLLWQIHFHEDINVKYVYYFLRSKNVRNHYGSLSTGSSSSMSNITQWDFSHSSIALPPCDEQTATVTYLDGKCSAIDSAIARKQSLIDSLTEYKKSLIYETVTGKREVPSA